jgi:single-strand DNA-binding protein
MSVNKWIGIGNLTRDPELRLAGDTPVCNFSIACNERYKDRNGQQQEKVEFVNIVAWRGLAEVCSRFLHKGKQVYVEGKLTTRKWQDKDGQDKYTTEVVIYDMQMLGSRDDGQREQRPAQQAQHGGGYEDHHFDPGDDSIPF